MKRQIKCCLSKVLSIMLCAALTLSVLLPMTAVSSSAYGYGRVDGETLADYFGMDGELYYQWLKSHEDDTYYLTTPYGDYDRRNPNGDCAGAYGELDTPGVPGMNCMGLIWHCLYMPTKMSGGDTDLIPAYGYGSWIDLYNSGISHCYFSSDQELLDSGYAEYGDIIWMFVEDEYVRNDDNHICIYVGDGHSDAVLHSVPDEVEIGYLGVDYEQFVVIKAGAIPKVDTPVLKSVSNTNKGPKITWNKVSGATYYRVFVKSGNRWKTLGTTRDNSFIDKNAKSGQKYTYTVRCVDGRGNFISGYNKNGISNTYYAAPSGFKAICDQRGISLSWKAVGGAAKYRVYRRTAGKAWEVAAKTTDTTILDTKAKAGVAYLYTVRVLDKDGNTVSAYNDPIKAYIINDIPTISDYSVGNSGLTLTWNSIRGAEQYAVFKKVGASWKTLGYTGTNSYTVKAPDSGVETLYTVRCVNNTHNAMTSGYDRTGYAAMFHNAPTISRLEAVSNGIKVTLNPQNNAERYRVYRKEAGSGWQKVGDTTGDTFVDTSAQTGKTYTYTLRVVTADGKKLLSGFDTKGWSINYAAAPAVKAEAAADGIRISWNAVPNGQNYRVFVKQNGSWRGLTNTKGTSYLYTGVEDGVSYTFTVRCYDAAKWFSSYYNTKGVTAQYTALAGTGAELAETGVEPETDAAIEASTEAETVAETETEE